MAILTLAFAFLVAVAAVSRLPLRSPFSEQGGLRPLTRGGQLAIAQKWLPSRPDQVLPFKKWMKAWHVKPGKLTPVIYHTYSHHPYFLQGIHRADAFLQWQLAHDCPKQIVGFDIEPLSPMSPDSHEQMKAVKNVSSAASCQRLCTEAENCTAWVWAGTGGWEYFCWRKRIHGAIRYIINRNVVSGLPCQRQRTGYWWPWQNQDLYDLPIPMGDGRAFEPMRCSAVLNRQLCTSDMERTLSHMPWPLSVFRQGSTDLRCCAPVEAGGVESACPTGYETIRTSEDCGGYDAAEVGCCPYNAVVGEKTSTMHCVMLFQAFSHEQNLVAMQHEMKVGVFECDSYALYSSQVIEIAPGVVSRRIHNSMMCELGGQFITALNLGIFLALYRQILEDQDLLKASWLVKVDPDTAWMPGRLRHYLLEHSWGIGGDGIYFNNCGDGLHGPIEVFSKGAFLALGRAARDCKNDFDHEVCTTNCSSVYTQVTHCNGPCTDWWGEDIWCDQCLKRHTKAHRVMVKTLLQEEHCKPHIPDWRTCSNQNTVAFHPFKDPAEFLRCVEAMKGRQYSVDLALFG